MELLAGLVLDSVGVRLQALHVALEDCVLALEIEHLPVELLGFLALFLVDEEAIGAKDDVVSDGHGQSSRSSRRRLPPPNGHAIQHGGNAGWQERTRSASAGECHSSKVGRGELRVNGTGTMAG
jgi:hypothetical protein